MGLTETNMTDRRYAALLNITRVLSETSSMERVLIAVADEVVAATGATACNSFLFPGPTGNGNYYIVGHDMKTPSGWFVPDPPDALAMESLKTGKPITVYDCKNDHRCDANSQKMFGITSAMTFPLVHHGETLAVGCVWFAEPHRFSQEEVDAVMAIAEVGALGVAHANLDQENQRLTIAEERSRLAQELHDSVCQSLASTKMSLAVLLRTEDLAPSARRKVEEALDLVNSGYADARDIIHSFRIAGVVDGDRFQLLQGYAADFSARTGVPVDCLGCPEVFQRLSPDASLQAIRIMGEALSNIRKHAHASHATLESHMEENNLVFSIEDDGVGMGGALIQGPESGHFGLSIMHERAAKMGATLAIEPVSPHGTRVVLTVPYR